MLQRALSALPTPVVPTAAEDDPSPYEVGPPFYADSKFIEDRVFAEELKAIRAAQPGLNLHAPEADANVEPEPDVGHGLVGLALSGGGIRSATFALGAVQALNENKVFDKLDYLSTVSGGGYLGPVLAAFSRKARNCRSVTGLVGLSIRHFVICATTPTISLQVAQAESCAFLL